MKKIFFIVILLFLSVGCAEKKYFTEVVSTKKVTISMYQDFNEQYLMLNIPIEFQLNLNDSDIKDVGIYWKLNNKILTGVKDYAVLNTQNNKIIFGLEDIEYPNYPKSIYLLNQTNKISAEQALELIRRYNPEANLQSIKSRRDFIPLVSYAQYRKDNPEFLKEMRKIPDSLILSIGFSGGKEKLFKEKINW